MAEFKSKYPAMGFYVGGELKRFSDGVYATDDKDEIAALEAMSDIERVDTPDEKPASKRKANDK